MLKSQMNKIKSLWIISIISSISLITSVSVISANTQTIFVKYPRIGIPSILIPGDTLSIDVLWPMGLSTQEIQISLENEFNSELFNGRRCVFLMNPQSHLVELIEYNNIAV